jgi:hypothetical protein
MDLWDYIIDVSVVVRALQLVNQLFLQLLQHCRAKNKSYDCDEAVNYMQLTFDNLPRHMYQLSGLNSDYAGRLG